MVKSRNQTPDIFKILSYFVAVVFLGAAFSPFLFVTGKSIATWLADGGYQDTPVLGFIQNVAESSDFSRYFKRSIMLAALLCLWPVIRWIRASGPISLGLQKNPAPLRDLFLGAALASAFLLAMGVVFHQMGAYVPREPSGSAWIEATLAAFGAGAIEELLFRGFLLGLVLRTCKPFTALLFITTLFAGVHFLNPPPEAALKDGEVGWFSGFWLIGQTFKNFGDVEFLLAEFSTLFAVGWVLGIARLRTGSLWLPIGLHAGWIFGLKIFSSHFGATLALKDGDWLPYIGINIKIGIVPLLIVSFTGILVTLLYKKVKKRSPVS